MQPAASSSPSALEPLNIMEEVSSDGLWKVVDVEVPPASGFMV
jgi:hypothetical protein